MRTLLARIPGPWTGQEGGVGENTTYSERLGSQIRIAVCLRAVHRDRVLTAALRSRL